MENKKSYYAIIPADIRYNDKISANAKLLYSEITALCNEKGYCWSTNRYFAGLYKTSGRTVRRWLLELIGENFIKIIDGDNQKRKIYIDKVILLPRQKCQGNHDKNVRATMTKMSDYNNTINNIKNKRERRLSFLIELPEEVIDEFTGKFNVSKKQLISKADDLHDYCQSRGKTYKNYKAFLRKAVKKDFGERLPEDKEKIAMIRETQLKHEGSSPYADILKNKMQVKR